jgi:hypothetical protein
MRRFATLVTTVALTMSGLVFSPAQAKVTKPSAPTISAVSSSAVKKGKVNVKVTIALPTSNGGSKITGSRVTAGGKTCTIAKTKTSCTIKSIKNGKALRISAKSKNKKGFSSASTSVAYTAGASAWPTTPVANVISDTPAASAPVAGPAPLTCATGGTCVVGDRGPGGGIVYYVSAAAFTSTGSNCNTSCRYLEVAPATWKTGVVANDQVYDWSDNQISTTGQNISTASTEGSWPSYEKVNWKIGQGFSNTSVMNVSGAASEAKTAVLAYAGNSTAGQWFIPSMNELEELCKYARGQATGNLSVRCLSSGTLKTGTANDLGGFVNDMYFSSSEYDNTAALGVDFAGDTFFYTGKPSPNFIRPVRAF